MLGVTAGAVWLAARQRRRTSSPLITHLIIGSGLVFLADMLYTRPALVPLIGPPETVTRAFPLAAIAFMIPPYGALAALSAWLWLTSMRSMRVPRAIRLAVPASDSALLTGIIRPGSPGWLVSWVTHGRSPRRLRAATLTSAIEQASEQAAKLYRHRPTMSDTELLLAIFPGPYKGGPIFEISGEPGHFTARDTRGSRTVHCATLEDLAAARAEAMTGGQCMLVWKRPLAELSRA